MADNGLILNKLYSVMLYDYCFHNCSGIDCFRVLGSSRFNGTLITHAQGKLVFNLQNKEGSVIIPFENIKWMVPLYKPEKEKEKKERTWLDDL